MHVGSFRKFISTTKTSTTLDEITDKKYVIFFLKRSDITCNQSNNTSAEPCISQKMGCLFCGCSIMRQFQGHPLKHRQTKLSFMYVQCSIKYNIKMGLYSRAKISCCLVSEEPLVGKKFSSNNDTFKERKKYSFLTRISRYRCTTTKPAASTVREEFWVFHRGKTNSNTSSWI